MCQGVENIYTAALEGLFSLQIAVLQTTAPSLSPTKIRILIPHLRSSLFKMCMFEDLSAPLSPTKPVVIEYEVHICKKEEFISVDAMSAKVRCN